jgi:uncharacterized Tic20 family protein
LKGIRLEKRDQKGDKMDSFKDSAQPSGVSARTAAMVAGLGLLLMAVLAPFANFYALGTLVVANDAKATAENIVASSSLFRIGITCFLIVAVLDVIVAWALYVLLEPIHKSLSLLAAWFRVVYAAVFAIALMPLLTVLHLLSGADSLKSLETNQLNAQVMLSLSSFKSGWDLGLVIFGFHLLVLGYLIFKSGFIPKWLGILVGIAGVGYLLDSLGKILIPDYKITVAMFTFVGEFLLIFWLLYKGIKGFEEKSPARLLT